MDTTRTLISRRFFRDSCRIMDGVYCKDLRKVVADVDPELKSVLIVDNIPENYMLQPDLGIPIRYAARALEHCCARALSSRHPSLPPSRAHFL